jgi:hypothetical protein
MARASAKPKALKPSAEEPGPAPPKTPSIVQIAQRLGRKIPVEELRLIPKDLSGQIDHYVYGSPKR